MIMRDGGYASSDLGSESRAQSAASWGVQTFQIGPSAADRDKESGGNQNGRFEDCELNMPPQ